MPRGTGPSAYPGKACGHCKQSTTMQLLCVLLKEHRGGVAVPLKPQAGQCGSGKRRDRSKVHSGKSWQGGRGRGGRWHVDVIRFKQGRGFGEWRGEAPRWEGVCRSQTHCSDWSGPRDGGQEGWGGNKTIGACLLSSSLCTVITTYTKQALRNTRKKNPQV